MRISTLYSPFSPVAKTSFIPSSGFFGSCSIGSMQNIDSWVVQSATRSYCGANRMMFCPVAWFSYAIVPVFAITMGLFTIWSSVAMGVPSSLTNIPFSGDPKFLNAGCQARLNGSG